MALRELAGGITDSASVRRVFGESIDREGVLIIPVASVRGVFGGGENASSAEDASEAGGTAVPAALPAGRGGGGAWSATPAGTYVLKNGEVSWVPAVDADRSVLLGCLTGIVALLVLRSVVRTIVKRG